MKKSDKIENLLLRILEEISNTASGACISDTDCGELYIPEFRRYCPTFEFTEEDIALIRELENDNCADFSGILEPIEED